MILDGMEGIWEGEWEGNKEEDGEEKLERNEDIKDEEENENSAKKTEKNREITAGEVYVNEVNLKSKKKPQLEKKMRDSQKFFENFTWLTSNEAASYLRLPSVGALRVLVCKRRVPFHKLGRCLRFRRAELDRLLESSRNGDQ